MHRLQARFTIIRKNSFDKKSRKVVEGFKDYTVDPSTRYIAGESFSGMSGRGSVASVASRASVDELEVSNQQASGSMEDVQVPRRL